MKSFVSDHDDIAQWRSRIFTSLISITLVLALATALPTAALSVQNGFGPVSLINALTVLWIAAIWRLNSLTYRVRVWSFLAMTFCVSIAAMMTVDALGLSYLMMVPSVMAVILLGLRPALTTLALSTGCMLVLGLAGYSHLSVAGFAHDSLPGVLILTLNFACVCALVTFTCSALLNGLSQSLTKLRGSAHSLETGKAALHALNGELRLTSAAFASLNEMVLIAQVVEGPGAVQPVIFANAAFERRSGYRADEILGGSLDMLHGPETEAPVVTRIVEAMGRREPVSAELVNYTKSGEPYWIEIDVVPFASEGGPVTHWVIVSRDITERRCAADAVRRLAFFDVLTGLPNRRLLMERLDVLLAKAQAGAGLGAVLYIDLDDFKTLNDARGHTTGDALLREVATRLGGAVRTGDTVARLGGDEFVVLMENLGPDIDAATAAALELARHVSAVLAQPCCIDGQAHHSPGSIGVALPTQARQTVHDLLREADTAMYQAKAGGAGRVVLFDGSMLAAAENRLMLERDLVQALDNEEFSLHLQLQVDPAGMPVGAEALLRWRRADGTFVAPDVFIPVAEASGLIVPIGQWVLREACRSWSELDQAGIALPLSINVSPRQFREPEFVAGMLAALKDSGIPPHQLILEITEGLLVDDLDGVVARMRELALLGIRFSIDDFGTGYSNLAYLRKMPLYELKIDKSFLRGVPDDANGTAIVQSILAMASHLDLRVVAEGIETPQQARFLAAHGAPYMQGYLFHRPMPVRDVIERLAVPACVTI